MKRALLILVLFLPAPAGAQQEGRAALKSLLLPGWGQRDLGQRRYADALLGSEILFWGGVVGWGSYAGWRRADSRRWAALNAGADLAGKDARWYSDLARFPDLYTYNAAQEAAGEPQARYPEGAGYEWRWSSEQAWARYRRFRRQARVAKSWANLAVGGIVLVRLVGAASALATGRSRAAPARGPGTVPAWVPVVVTGPDGTWFGLRIRLGG